MILAEDGVAETGDGVPGEALLDYSAIDLKKGGSAIPNYEEDPFIRENFERTLAEEGLVSRMDGKLYEPPA